MWFREPLEPVPQRECATIGLSFRFEHQLDTPLDGRPVVSADTGEEIPVADIALRRLAGGGLTSTNPRGEVGVRRQVGPLSIEVVAANSRGFDRLDGLRENIDHLEFELEPGVPAILIERPIGEQRLSFVVDHWFYDLLAEPGVETDEFIAFARGLEVGGPTPAAPPQGAPEFSSSELVVAREELRRSPTVLPEGFEMRDSRTYGLVHVSVTPIEPGQGFVRMDADPASVRVDILGEGDGVLQPIEERGWLRIGFEENGWFYDLTAQPEVSQEDLLIFARGFEIVDDGLNE